MNSLHATVTGDGSTGYDEVELLRRAIDARSGRFGRGKRSLRPSGDPFAFGSADPRPDGSPSDEPVIAPPVALRERLDALLG